MAVSWIDHLGTVLSNALQTCFAFSGSAVSGGAKVLGGTIVTNGATARVVTVYLIPSGQTAANQYIIWRGTTIPNDTIPMIGGPWPASASAFVQAIQDAGTDVILHIHAFVETP